MCPHAQHFDDMLFLENLIHESVLNVDPPGIRTLKISDQLLVRGWILEWVGFKNFQKFFCFQPELTLGEFLCVFQSVS